MKKFIFTILAISMVFALGACKKSGDEQVDVEEAPIVGGYATADSQAITDDIKKIVEAGTADLEGASYEPIAYLGSQVVAGTNHQILCKVTLADADATQQFAIVEFYEDLEGKVSITSTVDCVDGSGEVVQIASGDAEGGWTAAESAEVTADAKAALEKAAAGQRDKEYKPLAMVATQVVAGTNYCILCDVTPVNGDKIPDYQFVFVNEDAEGNCTFN